MCGRYNLVTDADALIDFFDIECSLADPGLLSARYNIAPGQELPVVRQSDAGRELFMARWGLVPHWSKEARPKFSTINARAETVAVKPAYREAFRSKRCLIPATGFYEWKQSGQEKTPCHIRPAGDGLFAFAGLWDYWQSGEDSFHSYSIIVTRASGEMQSIHQRMPVILNPSQYGTWLSTRHYDRAQLESLLIPWAGNLDINTVSKLVNNPRNDKPECLASRGSG